MGLENCQVRASEISDTTPARYQFQQVCMGVPWRIEFEADSNEDALAAQKAVFARVREIDRALSDYDPDSELNQLCQQAKTGEKTEVSEDLFTVLSAAQTMSCRSGGAFDVTVGHITDLWRRAYRKNALPEEATLKDALSRTSFRLLRLHPECRTVEFLKDDLQLDLGAIAKGYAADEALEVLKNQGIDRALIDASGDIVVGDPPTGAEHWVIGIAPLKSPQGEPDVFLKLANCSVATSGDASRYVEIDGTRYSHIVDPKTGIGLTESSSVTVIAPDGMNADALASALSVMGPEKGLAILKKYSASALIVLGTDDGFEQHSSAGFEKHLLKE
ncbi:FAD:protein FMN transferase [Rubinisphaera margarita]|uniref:FAD:protein FMN transferase n=1 Tax=Rubinisphaera margarita TaxID=2909586 RepID=UPI001EE9A31F|nr:FAD:protein FMN transferase [Rubinisphaera margarita]MCG6155310.1 FAD:protein FMN transferase [Rubinisphaera margarita]